MIICYGVSDVTGESPKAPLQEVITVFKHHRNNDYNRAIYKEFVRKAEAVPPKTKGYIFRHYCPFKRIFNAMQEYCLGKTRQEIIVWFFSDDPLGSTNKPCVINNLGIKPSQETLAMFEAVGSPLKSLLAFDTWLEWAFYSVCDWPANIFYGNGTGDGKGTKIDTPTTPGYADKQTARVKAALVKLIAQNPGLSDTTTVPVEKYAKIYTASGKSQLKRAIDIDELDSKVTLNAQKKLRVDGPAISQELQTLEWFGDDDNESDAEIP